MDVKLKVLMGANEGQEVPLDAPKFFIGRAEDCQLRPKSDLISRHHCVFVVESDWVAVRDLGSRNGTYVNDQRVMGEQALKPGDRIRVGPLEFELHQAETPAPKKRPAVSSVKEAAVRMAEQTVDNAADEDDVSRWLGESAPVAETREMRETPEPAASAPAAGDTTSLGTTISETQHAKSVPPAPKAPQSTKGGADSGKAAADVLRSFFRRR